MSKHLNSYESFLTKLGNNLGTTVNMYNQASNEFKKIDKDVLKITNGQEGGEYTQQMIDKPQKDQDE